MVQFYLGCHQPNDARLFPYCCINISRLINRKHQRNFSPNHWLLDAGIFSNRPTLEEYAWAALRWHNSGQLDAVVSPDILCNNLHSSVEEAQNITIKNYLWLRNKLKEKIYILPVLQGQKFTDYLNHLEQYQPLIPDNCWIGVGSLLQRNQSEIQQILLAIKTTRPDLKLHGFGCGLRVIKQESIRSLLFSADSSAWSKTAQIEQKDQHSPNTALSYFDHINKINQTPTQTNLFN